MLPKNEVAIPPQFSQEVNELKSLQEQMPMNPSLFLEVVDKTKKLLDKVEQSKEYEFKLLVQLNLGYWLCSPPLASNKDNLHQGLSYANEALSFFNKDQYPTTHKRSFSTIVVAQYYLFQLGEDSVTENLVNSIHEYKKTLDLNQDLDFIELVRLEYYLGEVFHYTKVDDKKLLENLNQSLHHYHLTLDIALGRELHFEGFRDALNMWMGFAYLGVAHVYLKQQQITPSIERHNEIISLANKVLNLLVKEKFPVQVAGAFQLKIESFKIAHLARFPIGEIYETIIQTIDEALVQFVSPLFSFQRYLIISELFKANTIFWDINLIEKAINFYVELLNDLDSLQFAWLVNLINLDIASAYLVLYLNTNDPVFLNHANERIDSALGKIDHQTLTVELAKAFMLKGSIQSEIGKLNHDHSILHNSILYLEQAEETCSKVKNYLLIPSILAAKGWAYEHIAKTSNINEEFTDALKKACSAYDLALKNISGGIKDQVYFDTKISMLRCKIQLAGQENQREENVILEEVDGVLMQIDPSLFPKQFLIFLTQKASCIMQNYSPLDPLESTEELMSLWENNLHRVSKDQFPEIYATIITIIGELSCDQPNPKYDRIEHYFSEALSLIDHASDSNEIMYINYRSGMFYSKAYVNYRTEDKYYQKALDSFSKSQSSKFCDSYMFLQLVSRICELHEYKNFLEKDPSKRLKRLESSIEQLSEAIKNIPEIFQNEYIISQSKLQLANAYFNSSFFKGKGTQYESEAIKLCNDVSSFFTAKSYDIADYDPFTLLAFHSFRNKHYTDALSHFESAISYKNSQYGAYLSKRSKKYFFHLPDFSELYLFASFCAYQLGQLEYAVELAENGRTRMVRDALASAQVNLKNASKADQEAFGIAVNRVKALEKEIEQHSFGLPDQTPRFILMKRMEEAMDDLNKIHTRIGAYVPNFATKELDFSQIAQISTKEKPLVYQYVNAYGALAIIVPHDGMITPAHFLYFDQFNQFQLIEFTTGMSFDGSDGLVMDAKDGLIDFQENTNQFRQKLNEFLPVLKNKLMRPISQHLTNLGYTKATLIPDQYFSLLPLHALMDGIEVSFCPSAYYLNLCHDALSTHNFDDPSYLGVGNPKSMTFKNLSYAELEVNRVGSLFPPEKRYTFTKENATLTNVVPSLNAATYIHFACHGKYEPDQALQSAIFLSQNEKLTMNQFLSGDFEMASRLVILSACQTGIVDQSTGLELNGFPAGFIQAGVPGIISSLWPVDDLSTTLLMNYFFQDHIARGNSPSKALYNAQSWLKGLTAEQVQALKNLHEDQSNSSNERGIVRTQVPFSGVESGKPYTDPYYWAGFYFTGV